MIIPAGKDCSIAVAISGGVDSAVAAALLKEQDQAVFGITMLLPDTSEDSSKAAALVANRLDIPLHTIDLRDRFSHLIIEPFIASYLEGETPNPCVLCNRLVKFGLLMEHARSLGASMLATGHYARVFRDADGNPHLMAAIDRKKDQSYFLAAIGAESLARAVFPLGEMQGKEQVRELARHYALPVAESKESQDVCFISEAGYTDILQKYPACPTARGLIVHRNGSLLGRHNGFWRFTVGQRKGLGIAWKEPLYVLEVQAGRNRIVVGEEQFLYSPGLVADEARWFGEMPSGKFEARCKIRYRHEPVDCSVEPVASGVVKVFFREPQRAVTPGQTLVVYDGYEVLGAATIKHPVSHADSR